MADDGESTRAERAVGPDTDFFEIGAEASAEEFLAVVRVYARRVVEAHDLTVDVSDLEWEVSTRAKRRAGAVKYTDGTPEVVSLTWDHFRNEGWAAAAETIRHELIHVHLLNEHGDRSHGEAFRQFAEELETTVQCEVFAEPKWWIVCRECSARVPRYRRSKVVKNPSKYRCGECDGQIDVVPNQSDG